MIFNGVSKEYLKVRYELFRPPTPPIEFYSKRIKGGTKTVNKEFQSMTLPVPITIRSDDNVEFLKEDLGRWLYHAEPKPLEFKQTPNRHYLAEYIDMQLEERGAYAKGVVNFHLAEAYRFSHEKQLTAINTTSSTHIIEGHTSTPYRATTKFTSSASSYTFEFAQAGITSLRDINKIVVNYDFIAGDSLEINYAKRSILLNKNDISNALSIINSNYKEMPVGSVEFKATNPTDVFYFERYY